MSIRACLSGRVPASPTAAEQQQQRSRANPSSSSERTDDTPPPFDAAAAAVIAAVDLVHKFLYAYAAMGYRFLQSHGAVAFDFLYAHALVVFEFLYAYAVVAVQETLAIVEKVWSRARPAWRRWRGRGPAPVKRVLKHRLFPVAVAVALSMLLVLPAYWAVPRVGGAGGDGPGRVSTRQWQVSDARQLMTGKSVGLPAQRFSVTDPDAGPTRRRLLFHLRRRRPAIEDAPAIVGQKLYQANICRGEPKKHRLPLRTHFIAWHSNYQFSSHSTLATLRVLFGGLPTGQIRSSEQQVQRRHCSPAPEVRQPGG